MDEPLNVPDSQVSLTNVAPSIASDVMLRKAIDDYVEDCKKHMLRLILNMLQEILLSKNL